MATILAFANQKGGVGKTTSAINIAAALGLKGKKTLLVDFDPQGNSTSGVGVRKSQMKNTVYDIIIGRAEPENVILKTEYENLWVLPSSMPLAAAEFELADVEHREARLKNALDKVRDSYDYMILDCPPSLGLLTVNALAAADGVIIPMQCEFFSLEGLSQIMMTVKQVKKLYNPGLALTGILITMYNGRLNLSVQVIDELKKFYADKLFSTPITRAVRLSEAPSFGAPIQYYDRYSKGALEYEAVAKELLARTK
ncbi:MAG: ParA family protein [Ruminococcus sp.]|nr:ParA family protein [Candidatus Apopatosoma intestinale]